MNSLLLNGPRVQLDAFSYPVDVSYILHFWGYLMLNNLKMLSHVGTSMCSQLMGMLSQEPILSPGL